ncbi:hypothetical protein HK104_011255 [Borealophlyctis nickersoniae]|nr:hypothetical protein HK104_011255 [Borealophlyctis nickersoniae]
MHSKTVVGLAALAAVGAVEAQSGSWARRVYYTGPTCTGNIGHAISVFDNHNGCPGGVTTAQAPVNTVCENKSTDALIKSAEGTGCDTVPSVSAVSDAPYYPSSGPGKVPGANYAILNQYNGASCGTQGGSVSITQTAFAADGKCYAMEPGWYFKAWCNSTGSLVVWCKDNKCEDCPQDGERGVFRYAADCSGTQQGQPVRSICDKAAGNADQPLPNVTVNGNQTTVSPLPNQPSTNGSTSSNTTGSSPSPSANGTNSNAGAKESMSGVALFGALLAALAF